MINYFKNKHMRNLTSGFMIVAFLFTFLALPANSYAQYKDKSSDFPLLENSDNIAIIIATIAVVALLAGVIGYAKKSKTDKKEDKGTPDSPNARSHNDLKERMFSTKQMKSEDLPHNGLKSNLLSNSKGFQITQAGLSYKF